MKVIDIDVKCDSRNNGQEERDNNIFRYEIFIKYDSTTNFLCIEGCSAGGMFMYAGNQFENDIINLYHIPTEIKDILLKLHDKCDGFKISDNLYDVVRYYLIEKLNGIDFELFDDDKTRIENIIHKGLKNESN